MLITLFSMLITQGNKYNNDQLQAISDALYTLEGDMHNNHGKKMVYIVTSILIAISQNAATN